MISELKKKKFGEEIKAKRKIMGISQTECAKRIGISLNQFRQYEYGLSVPHRKGRMDEVCAFFGINEEEYIDKSGE